MRAFKAEAAAAIEMTDVNTFAVVMVEHQDGGGARLEIQKSLTFDEQDRMHGHDTYCLSTEEGATHYGGVVSWTIGRGSLTLHLDTHASDALGVENGFIIGIDPQDEPLLQEGLRNVLGRDPDTTA